MDKIYQDMEKMSRKANILFDKIFVKAYIICGKANI
jgi:hypothetical protein